MSTKDTIQKQIADNPVILYMKGVPTAPECGFSAKAIAALNATNIPYAYVNVLKAPHIREKLPTVSKWPTFPQLFVGGELVGGADIVEAMSADGSLLPLLENAVKTVEGASDSTAITHSEVEGLIAKAYPDAQCAVEGQGCDLTVTVVSAQFDGLTMVKQHQGVMAALNEPLTSGRLHAITLKTYTPGQWQSLQAGAGAGLLQIQG